MSTVIPQSSPLNANFLSAPTRQSGAGKTNRLNSMDAESQTPHPVQPAPTESAPASSLQFDRAEFATPAAAALSCEVCKTPLQGEYYQVNGKNICPACRTKIDANFTSGSKFQRFGKAAVAGVAG